MKLFLQVSYWPEKCPGDPINHHARFSLLCAKYQCVSHICDIITVHTFSHNLQNSFFGGGWRSIKSNWCRFARSFQEESPVFGTWRFQKIDSSSRFLIAQINKKVVLSVIYGAIVVNNNHLDHAFAAVISDCYLCLRL